MSETLTACPICYSANIRAKSTGTIMVSVCRDCDQHFVNPRMTDDEAAIFYQGEYWDKMNVRSGENLRRHRDRARLQAIEMRKWIAGLNTALEIGCASGYLLDQLARGYDMDCRGVEPDLRYHKVDPAKRYTLYRDIAAVPCIKFDLIAMSHSLEHLNHPREYLEHLIEYHTHARTRIMIEVPNLDYKIETLTRQHPFAFTEKTLNGLFALLGYHPLIMIKHGLGLVKQIYLLAMYGRNDV